jgi:hypothetical protein
VPRFLNRAACMHQHVVMDLVGQYSKEWEQCSEIDHGFADGIGWVALRDPTESTLEAVRYVFGVGAETTVAGDWTLVAPPEGAYINNQFMYMHMHTKLDCDAYIERIYVDQVTRLKLSDHPKLIGLPRPAEPEETFTCTLDSLPKSPRANTRYFLDIEPPWSDCVVLTRGGVDIANITPDLVSILAMQDIHTLDLGVLYGDMPMTYRKV